jgi:hypothetical protein
MLHGMPSTTDAELSLINDAQFLEELESADPFGEPRDEPDADAREIFADAFAALDKGLAVKAAAQQPVFPPSERPPIDEARADEADAASETRIPFGAAAVVLIVCLTAGAASAAAMFHDRLTQITAPRSASR